MESFHEPESLTVTAGDADEPGVLSAPFIGGLWVAAGTAHQTCPAALPYLRVAAGVGV